MSFGDITTDIAAAYPSSLAEGAHAYDSGASSSAVGVVPLWYIVVIAILSVVLCLVLVFISCACRHIRIENTVTDARHEIFTPKDFAAHTARRGLLSSSRS